MKSSLKQSVIIKVLVFSGIFVLFLLFTASIYSIFPVGDYIKYVAKQSNLGETDSGTETIYDKQITDNQRKVDVLHYDLFFDLYPEEKEFIATATITACKLEKGLNTIDFNFYENYKTDEVTLNGIRVDYQHNDKILSINPTTNSLRDTFEIRIDYSGKPRKVGLSGFVFGKINGYSLVYTLSEPNYASSWYPCNDFPDDKSIMDMRIRNDSSRISISNGKLVSVENDEGKRIFHWKTEYPISTYLIALYSADYTHFADSYISIDEQDTMAIDYYVLPDKYELAKVDFAEHPEMIRFFAETFGEYPFIKEKYGVAQFLWSGAMENQTITGVSWNLITGNNSNFDYYIHELAHHWWGNAVGPKSWKDIWLNESFSSYCEALYFEFKYGKSALQSTMLSKKLDPFDNKLADPGAYLFTATVYDKGAWILHMLRRAVDKLTFIKILRSYYQRYKYSNATTEDFIRICEEVSGKKLDKFFEQWLYGEGIIELEYNWETKKNRKSYLTSLNLKQTQNGYEEYHFPLDVKIEFDNIHSEIIKFNVSSIKSEFSFETDIKPEQIILDPNNWLLMTSYNKGNN
ncbi:MAG: M1 family metallopeptidase [Ignavibacteria bacterium]|jgi:aminopeptidase N